MHALAVEAWVHSFVGEKEIWLIDDCSPDIFTNVKGPIVCAKDQLSFLVEQEIHEGLQDELLSDYVRERMERLLGN